MKPPVTPVAPRRWAPPLVVSLTFVTGATFGAGLLFATALGDYLPKPVPASAGRSCTSGCPTMLPCGVPLSSWDSADSMCEFPEK